MGEALLFIVNHRYDIAFRLSDTRWRNSFMKEYGRRNWRKGYEPLGFTLV